MGRLTGLDALRGAAAAIVLSYHLGRAIHCEWIFPKGYLSVDFFFVLSGYVLSRTYDARFKIGLTSIDFFIKRVKRLWPTMAVATLLATPLLLVLPAEVRMTFLVAGLLFVPLLIDGNYFPLNGPQWSILFELFANALHGLVLHRLSTRHLTALVAISALCSGMTASRIGHLDIGWEAETIAAGFPRAIMGYGMGMLLWRIMPDRLPTRLPAWIAPLALPLAIWTTGAIEGQTWLAEMAFVLIVCPAVVTLGAFWEPGHIGALAGSWSFPLYAFHAPLIYGALSFGLHWPAIVGLVVLVSAIPVVFQQWRPHRQATIAIHS